MRKAKTGTIGGKARATADAATKEHHGKSRQDSVSTGVKTEFTSTYSPEDFDVFIPWVCRQWASSSVLITRKAQGIFSFLHTYLPKRWLPNWSFQPIVDTRIS